jgi:glycosyltransferase involved in cell wall biosynthesis
MMLSNPKISIVTPSYNQGDYIESAIQSVLSQGYSNLEHIILDNCSSDQTLEILQRYDHLVWKSEPDRGQSDALNRGFQMASGEIMGWLNADDRYLPGCFRTVTDGFQQHLHSDVLYGDYRWINGQGDVLQSRREIDFDWFILKYLHVLYIPSTSTFFRRRVFDEGNFLDPSFKYSMDYEFFIRLAQKGYQFTHLPSYLADFRWHSNNKSTIGLDKQFAEMNAALLRHDGFLNRVPVPLRASCRETLKWVAQCKRYLLKGMKGYYFDQWQPRPVETEKGT